MAVFHKQALTLDSGLSCNAVLVFIPFYDSPKQHMNIAATIKK